MLQEVALIDDVNAVRVHNCLNTVRNHQTCLAPHHRVSLLNHLLLCLTVQGQSSLVQDHYLGLTNQGSGHHYSLLLSS